MAAHPGGPANETDTVAVIDARQLTRIEDLMDQHFDPVVLRLIDLLQRALPGCPRADIFWGYHFVTGALMLTLARTGRIDKLSGGLCRSDDFHAVTDRMARFMAAGFREICKYGED